MKINWTVLLAGCVAIAGCSSPEATRARGEGPGGDTGNRPAEVMMHEGSDPYWNTPVRIGVEHPPLEPARQARERSKPSSRP
ncbi:MAG TPA: hypothetical protein VK911_14430 [Vicinamibacterales bacterium]|nr:hypothetical protein [Vicinamibacterales bacterium]